MLLFGLLLASQGRAWDRPTEVVQGTARVLEKGEMTIGILTPLGYGLHERVTIFTHPILDLLLTPNIWLRVDLWSDEQWAVALETGYQQSFLSVAAEDGSSADARYPGYLQAGFAASFAVRLLQVTLATGYEGWFSSDNDLSDVFLYYRVGLDLLASERNLVMVRVIGDVGLNPVGFEIPTVTLIYAREFGRMRLGAGISAGSFPMKGLPARFDVWPVYPWIDLWWRF
ncbi:MAG: hypothetical protein ABIK09_03360 [Pseudomonadota bacterium]